MARVTRSELFAPDEIAIVHVVNRVVDLNPIRAAMPQTLEDSGHTSVQRRIQAEQAKGTDEHREERLSGAQQHQSGQRATGEAPTAPDRFLSPLELDEQHGPAGACSSSLGVRCSDKGFLPMSVLRRPGVSADPSCVSTEPSCVSAEPKTSCVPADRALPPCRRRARDKDDPAPGARGSLAILAAFPHRFSLVP